MLCTHEGESQIKSEFFLNSLLRVLLLVWINKYVDNVKHGHRCFCISNWWNHLIKRILVNMPCKRPQAFIDRLVVGSLQNTKKWDNRNSSVKFFLQIYLLNTRVVQCSNLYEKGLQKTINPVNSKTKNPTKILEKACFSLFKCKNVRKFILKVKFNYFFRISKFS